MPDFTESFRALADTDLDHANIDVFAEAVRSLANASGTEFWTALTDIDPRNDARRSEFLHESIVALGAAPERFAEGLLGELERLFALAEGSSDPHLEAALDGFEGLGCEPSPLQHGFRQGCLARLESSSAFVRRMALRLLEGVLSSDDPGGTQRVLRQLETDRDWRVRALAFSALAELEPLPEEIATRLRVALSDDEDARVRRHACWAAQFVPAPAPLLAGLERALSDASFEVRRGSYLALMRHAPERRPKRSLSDLLRGWFASSALQSPLHQTGLADLEEPGSVAG